ncbi:hypothetical protein, partial [Pseudomonas sp. BF-R-16]|uniref:hypothetical protein n=1 Tax=Pseudomonas sp. BF-R-16 TaxID=2832362 RepID=UPI001CC11402
SLLAMAISLAPSPASWLLQGWGVQKTDVRPGTKELAISALRAIVARAAAPKNLHQTGKISRV